MSKKEKIISKAQQSLEATKIEANKIKQAYFKTKQLIERILFYAEKNNYSGILNLSNYDIFLTYTFNVNYYSEPEELNQLYKTIEKLKKTINSWTYDNYKDLMALFEGTDTKGHITDNNYMKYFERLGLPLTLLDYNLHYSFEVAALFLQYKKLIADEQNILGNVKNTPLIPSVITRTIKNNQILFDSPLPSPSTKDYTLYCIGKYIDFAKGCLEEYTNDYLETSDAYNGRIKWTNQLITYLKKHDEIDYDLLVEKWHLYLDPEILEELYSYVHGQVVAKYNANKQIEEELSKKINHSELTSYLYRNHLDPNSIPSNTREQLESIPNIIKYINTLENLGLSLSEILTTYCAVLFYLNDEKIEKISFLLENKIISKETLRNNLFIILDEKYRSLMNNYEILKDIIDFNNIFYNDKIMFIDYHDIKKRLICLAEYQLTKNNFIFLLCNFEYINIYDLVLEHDIPKELFISICKTSNPLNTIRRILIYQSIDEPFETPTHYLKRDVRSEERFCCSDDKLSEYLPNIRDLVISENITNDTIINYNEDEIIKRLDELFLIDDIYIIGNINISRPKFLRNYSLHNFNPNYLIPSLISSSIIDEQSYYTLISTLSENTLKKGNVF